ncbi:RICIN domain-containing protein [Pseudomonas sp. P1.31]|uniref:RICIN domain-containing protein n=1 Tax=Pseudomonas sp. P1.31 TaxID=1699311 RepID=UPI00069D0766|nr:RICIN domain-containing protein [Pseudomonas sp. P1.31]
MGLLNGIETLWGLTTSTFLKTVFLLLVCMVHGCSSVQTQTVYSLEQDAMLQRFMIKNIHYNVCATINGARGVMYLSACDPSNLNQAFYKNGEYLIAVGTNLANQCVRKEWQHNVVSGDSDRNCTKNMGNQYRWSYFLPKIVNAAYGPCLDYITGGSLAGQVTTTTCLDNIYQAWELVNVPGR